MKYDDRPIGIFDSGLGGLTSVKAVAEALPNEKIVYFGDTARVPYGDRSKETIIEYVKDDIEFLLSHNVKAIVIACNTADSLARPEMEQIFRIPIVGVVGPAAKKAVQLTKNGKIGVIGTNATIQSNAYCKVIHEYNASAEVFSVACPLLVPLVEEGRISKDDKVTRRVLKEYLLQFTEKDIDTLVLGCTHYPLLSGIIAEILPGVKLINSGEAAVESLKKKLNENELSASPENRGCVKYYVSDNAASFARHGGIFMGHELTESVTEVSI